MSRSCPRMIISKNRIYVLFYIQDDEATSSACVALPTRIFIVTERKELEDMRVLCNRTSMGRSLPRKNAKILMKKIKRKMWKREMCDSTLCEKESNVGPVPVAAPLAVTARGARLPSAPTTDRILRQDLLAPVNCKGRLPLLPETQPSFPSFLAHACTTNRRTWYVMDFAWRDTVFCCCYSLLKLHVAVARATVVVSVVSV